MNIDRTIILLVNCCIYFQGAKQRFEGVEKKGKSYMQLRKIRQFDEDFDSGDFADQALDIFIEAHNLLQE